MTTVFKWVGVGDLQMPYHNKRAVALFMKACKYIKPDAIDFLGDIDDQLEYSSFSDGTTDEAFNQLSALGKEYDKAMLAYEKLVAKGEEPEQPVKPDLSPINMIKENAQAARGFYEAVRKQHPNADIHLNEGNHDLRIFKYVNKKAPDYIDAVTPNLLWGVDDLGITLSRYDLPPVERFGGIHTHHGKTVSSSGLSVRQDIDNYNISLMRGHDHKGGVVYKTYPMSGLNLVGIGAGHLCDPSAYGLRYTINPDWELGFVLVRIFDGLVQPEFVRIEQGSEGYVCIIDGKVIKE